MSEGQFQSLKKCKTRTKTLWMDIHLRHNLFQIRFGTLLAVVLCLGCGSSSDGPALGLVEGTVTLDDEPLAEALVVFNPVNGKQSNGQTDSEGHYSLTYLRDIKEVHPDLA